MVYIERDTEMNVHNLHSLQRILINARHSHANHSTVLKSCKKTRELIAGCILYTPVGNATWHAWSTVTWKLICEAGR